MSNRKIQKNMILGFYKNQKIKQCGWQNYLIPNGMLCVIFKQHFIKCLRAPCVFFLKQVYGIP